ncbi:MAG: hypothetical protein F7C81_06305 [Desulfurococcales archaeon]|nr:hypothetical protein [Desulfurococcales archaeon]MEB3779644.1 hypothetical protein [Desulfurococcales archaeon]
MSESECRIRVYGGGKAIDSVLDSIKEEVYRYNTLISKTGYYLKPVHKVYKRRSDGSIKVYEYYGRYWWRFKEARGGKRLVYAGKEKPKGLPSPPRIPLEGLSVIREDGDVIVDCRDYNKYIEVFKGLKAERTF